MYDIDEIYTNYFRCDTRVRDSILFQFEIENKKPSVNHVRIVF